MNIEFRLPSLTASEPQGQIRQLYSFLRQTVEQLNWALGQLDSGTVQAAGTPAQTNTVGNTEAAAQFSAIKGLIIKSADIVNAYYTAIDNLLKTSGEYVAQSDFGDYQRTVSQQLAAGASDITALYTDLQQLRSAVDGINDQLVNVTARIKTGLLYEENGIPVYGVEVGQTNLINGQEVFRKYARFTANKLSFYDQYGTEVAYISDTRLYITNIHVTGSLSHGGFLDKVNADGSISTKWIGGDHTWQ